MNFPANSFLIASFLVQLIHGVPKPYLSSHDSLIWLPSPTK